MPCCRIPSSKELQPLSDGIRVRSNNLAPSDAHPFPAPSRAVPTAMHPKTWNGPFLSGDRAKAAAAVTAPATGGDGVASMMDPATAHAFLTALAGRAHADPRFPASVPIN